MYMYLFIPSIVLKPGKLNFKNQTENNSRSHDKFLHNLQENSSKPFLKSIIFFKIRLILRVVLPIHKQQRPQRWRSSLDQWCSSSNIPVPP